MPGADPGPGDSGPLLSVSRGRAAWTRGGRDQTLPPGGPGTGRSLDASCGGAASGGPQLDRGAALRSGQQGRAERLGRASHARRRPQTQATVTVLLGQAVTSLLCRTGNAQRQGLLGWGLSLGLTGRSSLFSFGLRPVPLSGQPLWVAPPARCDLLGVWPVWRALASCCRGQDAGVRESEAQERKPALRGVSV